MYDTQTGYNDHADMREAFEERAAEEREARTESGPMNSAKWRELAQFLGALNTDELARVSELAELAYDRAHAAERAICTDTLREEFARETISIANWTNSLPPRQRAGVASIGNGLYARVGKRGA